MNLVYVSLKLDSRYLDSIGTNDDRRLNLNDYKLIRADSPGSDNRGGVYLFKEISGHLYNILMNVLFFSFPLKIGRDLLFHLIDYLLNPVMITKIS